MPKSKHQIPGRVRIDVRIHQGSSRRAYRGEAVSRSRSGVERLLRVAETIDLDPRARDAGLLRLIRASFVASHGIYGGPRAFLDLREAGESCSKHRVARLMRHANLRAFHGCRTRRLAGVNPRS